MTHHALVGALNGTDEPKDFPLHTGHHFGTGKRVPQRPGARGRAGETEQHHPWLSPVYADYAAGFPPTLIQGGSKEIFLSNFIRHYQALDQAGVEVKLDIYEGMPHVFQGFAPELPESKLARQKVRSFLDERLGPA